MVTEELLETWFTYHPASSHPEGAEVAQHRHETIREGGYHLARLLFELVPAGPDQTAAIRKVREAVMTANAGVACEGQVGL